MKKSNRKLLSMALLVLVTFPAIAQKKVMLDNYYNNEFNSKSGQAFHYLWSDTALSGFSQLGGLFEEKGARLMTLKEKPSLSNLQNADVYILVDPDTPKETSKPKYMDKKAASAIEKWVKDGGTLLILANDFNNAELDRLNVLSTKFGIRFNKDLLHPEKQRVNEQRDFNSMSSTDLPEHLLFKGVKKIFLKEVSSLQCSYPSKPVLEEEGHVLIAEAFYGKGYVLVVGDPWLYNEYIDNKILPTDIDNLTTAKNLATLLLAKGRSLENPFFTFNNALNASHLPKLPIEKQAEILKNLGYDGMEWHDETDGFVEAIELFSDSGLKIYTNYMKINIDEKQPYDSSWKETIPKLDGMDMILWVHLHSEKYQPSEEAADSLIVSILQDLADQGKPYGVRIAIYHHTWFVAEKAEDSYRLAVKANRDNVGAVFNICHYLKTGGTVENLNKVLDMIYPKLFAISVSGADTGDTKNMNWDQLVQPLGQGTFDVYQVVKHLADKGFRGPIGLQCYNLKTDPMVHLKQSREIWESYKKRYAAEQ